MGRATVHSDYDCAVIFDDAAPEAAQREIDAFRGAGLDLMAMTVGEFERYAAWGSSEAWARYGFSRLRAIVDKTGKVQPLIDAKGCVPADASPGFIDASLDHLINQLYRGLKCLRDGDPVASRLEATEGARPLLDAAFALHGGRLRPYYKYLAWELETQPLERLPFDGPTLIARLADALGADATLSLRGLVTDVLPAFRVAGHGAVFDAWGEAMVWMLDWSPT